MKTERNVSEKEEEEMKTMIKWVTGEERQKRKNKLAEYMKIRLSPLTFMCFFLLSKDKDICKI